ncbi:MAG: hypothetical protein M0Z84_05995 [Gammaproteobacteria bacterium]|nr:hypothetical protein [Gammaproteobacteria bacterium]
MAWLASAGVQLRKITAGFRPQRARWFETYTPRDETVQTLEVLAQSGRVELELDPRSGAPLDIADLRNAAREFEHLSDRYRDYWPRYDVRPTGLIEPPEQTARTALDRLRAWSAHIDPLLDQLAALRLETDNLHLLREYTTGSDAAAPNLSALSKPVGLLCKCLFCCPMGQALDVPLHDIVAREYPRSEHRYFLLFGLPEHIAEIERIAAAGDCRRLSVPPWLPERVAEQGPRIDARLAGIAQSVQAVQRQITAMKDEPALVAALGDMAVLEWYIQHVPATAADQKFCHVTGWTTDSGPQHLQEVLRNAGLHAMLRFPLEPPGTVVPVHTRTLWWWVQPFQVFTKMFGTPEENEVDPSGMLVLIVPLLFGYMFPDVGHGLVLVLLSLALYRRWPDSHFLIPCGIFSVLFGFVFGEIFGFDGVIAPLWTAPLARPLDVLAVPLLFGVVLIILGLLLGGVEAYWRGRWRAWLVVEGAVPVLYAGSLGMFFDRDAGLIAAAALGWYYVGSFAQHRQHPLKALATATGALLESILRLGLNTVSFLRVGAFALGHAAFSAVIQELAKHAGNPILYALVLFLGNALLIAIEALLVFVQTTRLVLFEFFVRFLRAEGRVFKPLSPPVPRPR